MHRAARRPVSRFPHLLCRILHPAIFLLGVVSALAACVEGLSVLFSLMVIGALVCLAGRLILGVHLLDGNWALRPGVQEMWAYTAVGADVTLCICSALLSHAVLSHPGRAASITLGWNGGSYTLVLSVVFTALLWQALHLRAAHPAGL